jgi:hypothetical protein
VRFVDLLRATVLLSAAAATALALVTIAAARGGDDPLVLTVAVAWWLVAALIGARLGHRAGVTAGIGRVLADARSAHQLPELRPTATLVNRLWPLLVLTVLAGGLALVVPQVPAVTTGFAILWALAWRRQDAAVRAIEERDGVEFFVERTSPFRAVELVRVPGLRRETALV